MFTEDTVMVLSPSNIINPLTLASPLYNLQTFTAIVAVRAGVSCIVGSTCIGAKTSWVDGQTPGRTDTVANVVLGTTIIVEEGPAMGNNTELLSIRPPAEDAVAIAVGITVEDGTVPVDTPNPARETTF
jgi:hypothetical protein